MRRLVTAALLWFAAASCGGGGTEPAPIDLVTVTGDTTVVIAGTTALSAAASAGGMAVTTGVTFLWSSSDTSKATVNAAGVVTGKVRGTVTITAEAVNNGTPTSVTGHAALRVRIAGVVIPSAPGPLASLGDTVTLSAQAKDAASGTVSGVVIAWTSTNAAAATVDPATGLVTAVANGTTSVIAAAQGERAADTVTVTVAQVATSLVITPDTAAFTRIGATLAASVTANDARGHAVAGTAIAWSSTLPAVASVDAAGTITAHDDGTTYVIGTSGGLSDSVKVVVGLVYASVTVATGGALPAPLDSALITRLNGSLQLGLIVRDSGNTIVPNPQNVTWALKTGAIAAISGTGLITGNALTGRDTIVLVARTARDSVPLIVRQDVASIAITPASPADLNFVGDTQTFAGQAKDAGGADIPGKTYTWSTSRGILGIDAGGLAHADSATSATGVVVFVRVVVDNVKDSVSIRVKQVPNSAALNPNSFGTLTAFGQHVVAACVVLDSAADTIPNHPCTWSAVTPSVVTFSPAIGASTTITAVGNGSTTIKATYYLRLFAPNFVTVQQAVARVKLHPQTVDTSRILADSTMRFVDSVFDANNFQIKTPAPSVTWSSTRPVATVDTTGLVTAGSVADTTFIVAASGGVRDSAFVRVTTTAITLSTNVQPVFTTNCALSGCHAGATPMQGQNLSAGQTYSNVVNVAANELLGGSGLKRVLPSRPDSSYLVHKIQGTQLLPPSLGSGVQMPEGHPPLPKGTINLIRNWILQGARNN